MQRTELCKAKERVLNDLLDSCIPVDSDPEKSPNVQDELVEMSRLFANIGSNSAVLIFLVLFWRAKVIVIDVIETILYIQ
jgi:hypothetical protein